MHDNTNAHNGAGAHNGNGAGQFRRGVGDVFWAEMPPCDHSVHMYDREDAFIDALEGFVAHGLRSGEAVIVLATPEHCASLEARFEARGIDVQAAAAQDRYICLDAADALKSFMGTLQGQPWPDEGRFEAMVDTLLARARGTGATLRPVRAFGELVALLWAQGGIAATVQLERIWHDFCHRKEFSLFCAYPRAGFTDPADEAIQEIIAAHSRVFTPGGAPL